MDYTPEVGHTVVFADTYASDVEYNVTAVEDNRVTVSLTNPHEGYDAVSINMTFDVAREMGIAQIGAGYLTSDEIEALDLLLYLATVEYEKKMETARLCNSLAGLERAMELFPVDELVSDLANLTAVSALIKGLKSGDGNIDAALAAIHKHTNELINKICEL